MMTLYERIMVFLGIFMLLFILIRFFVLKISIGVFTVIFLPIFIISLLITYYPFLAFLIMLISSIGLICLNIEIPLERFNYIEIEKHKFIVKFLKILKKYSQIYIWFSIVFLPHVFVYICL